jgi:hypothetical protein
LGDCYDLASILEWCTEFWEGARWDTAVADDVAVAQLSLCRAFESTETAHRREHGLAAAKKAQAKSRADYARYVDGRRALLAHVAPPGPGGTAAEWVSFHAGHLLHLLPGDPGYVSWGAAKHAFLTNVERAVVRVYGDDNPDGEERLGEIFDSFPVFLEAL